ncbi:MAG: alpha/beta hydrolase-fold protein [Capsulimonadaceae bacterium]|nr:alpha/beta hydrolase-fold protein [Capsulimonadaceae bacterium]
MSIVSTVPGRTDELLRIGPAHVDETRIIHYQLQSCFQRRANADGTPAFTDLRIIEPSCGIDAATRFLYVLPVQPGTPLSMGSRWTMAYGDGIAAMRALDVANIYNVLVVEPGFNAVDFTSNDPASGPAPWYGDSPSNPQIRQESYIVRDIVPTVDAMYPSASRVRMLIGYSKSGWGAINLLLRHPDLFASAAAWDAPLMMREISPCHYANEDIVYGRDNAYFDRVYRLDAHIASASALKAARRIWIGINAAPPLQPSTRPYAGNFPQQGVDFTKVLDASNIPYTLHWPTRQVRHSWSPTTVDGKEIYWETGALEFLLGDQRP